MSAETVPEAALTIQISGLGNLRGTSMGDVTVFRGIPYAAPPVGPLRFDAPQPPHGWDGIRDASRAEAIAPQTPSRVYQSMGAIDAAQDESCLTLTIWKPTRHDGALPVIVWLHGGGFLTGGGGIPWYDGSALARQGVMVVGVNYRLGALGFLSVPGSLPGNLAILDQQAAFAWVRSHIAVFGGDPQNVTAMGQSGGAHNIASLLTMPDAANLFQRVILQSGPFGIGLATAEDAATRGEIFLKMLGLDSDMPDLLEKLRAISIPAILEAQNKTAMALGKMEQGDLRPPFLPTVLAPHSAADKPFLDQVAQSAADAGIALLIGWTREEANLFLAMHPALAEISEERLSSLAGGMSDDAEALLSDAWVRRPAATPRQLFFDLVNDLNFRLPAMALANAVTAAGGRAFVYQFDWQSTQPALGACHCLELPFTFGSWRNWQGAAMIAGANGDEMDRLSRQMMQHWVAFANTGQPGFPSWTGDSHPIMHFNTDSWLEGL